MPRVDKLPAFAEVRAEAGGALWVRHFSPPHDVRRSWTVLDERGALLARAITPDGADVLEIGRDYLVILNTDDLGIERVEVRALRSFGC